MGFSLQWFLLLQSTGPGPWASVVAAHRLSCFVECELFLDHGLNPFTLHWLVDSYALCHQGSPTRTPFFLNELSGISTWQIMCSLSVEEEKHLGQEWVVSMSECVCVSVCVFSLSLMSDSVILWTVACQAHLSMGFSRQEYRSGLPFSSPGDLPDPRIKLTSPVSPALQMDSCTAEPPRKPRNEWWFLFILSRFSEENYFAYLLDTKMWK